MHQIDTSMKKLMILIVAIVFTLPLFSQNISEGKDGLYYDSQGALYTGTYRNFYENGQIKTEIPLINGLKSGSMMIYFQNGQTNEIRSYKDGKMDGTWLTFTEKGSKVAEANYANGIKNGKWFIWDENGILRYDMTYDQGKKVGLWIIFDEKGNKLSERNYNATP